uniref:Putative secreted protein n=1 Tax=Rhipicephalus microplus TaxID=6941 RepID=A0A6M2DBH2_RHIMP
MFCFFFFFFSQATFLLSNESYLESTQCIPALLWQQFSNMGYDSCVDIWSFHHTARAQMRLVFLNGHAAFLRYYDRIRRVHCGGRDYKT